MRCEGADGWLFSSEVSGVIVTTRQLVCLSIAPQQFVDILPCQQKLSVIRKLSTQHKQNLPRLARGGQVFVCRPGSLVHKFIYGFNTVRRVDRLMELEAFLSRRILRNAYSYDNISRPS